MLGLSPLEIGVILLVVVLLFGTRRLPELGSGLGEAIANFKKTLRSGNALDVTPETKEQNNQKKDKEDTASRKTEE